MKNLNKLAIIGLSLAIPSLLMADGIPDGGIQVLSSPKGCFVLGKTSIAREDQFLIDTCTGRVWKMFEDTSAHVFFFQALVFENKSPVGGTSFTPPPISQATK